MAPIKKQPMPKKPKPPTKMYAGGPGGTKKTRPPAPVVMGRIKKK